MPSVSGSQHRLFGFWKSHPEARPHSLSAEQVSEWLHADKGKHFAKADGGAANDQPSGKVDRALGIVRMHKDFGGAGGFPSNPPFFARAEARGETTPDYGLVSSAVPGRTDRHPADVAAGTYVLPADVVSGLAEGNTLSGAAVIDRALHSAPFGIQSPHLRGSGRPIPAPPRPYEPPEVKFAKGGQVDNGKVPIIIAGGEFLIPPHIVAFHKMLGGGDPNNKDPKAYQEALSRGHDVLDAFVKHARGKTIKDLKHLPGPRKD